MNPDPFHYGIIRPYAGMGIGFPNSGPRPSRPFHKKRPPPTGLPCLWRADRVAKRPSGPATVTTDGSLRSPTPLALQMRAKDKAGSARMMNPGSAMRCRSCAAGPRGSSMR